MTLIRRLQAALEGWPTEVLTALLIFVAGFLIYMALFGPPLAKAVTLAWVVAP